jgi:hypothetical protein
MPGGDNPFSQHEESKMTDAKKSLADATANESSKRALAAAANHEWRTATGEYDRQLAAAARGEPVETTNLMAAKQVAAEKKAAYDLAASILEGATATRHRAEIVAWAGEAETLQRGIDDAHATRPAAQAAVDEAKAALDRTVERLNETGRDISAATRAAHDFNTAHTARAASNPIYASLPTGEAPRVRNLTANPAQHLGFAPRRANLGWD